MGSARQTEPLAVPCYYCGAPAWQPCVSDRGRTREYAHRARHECMRWAIGIESAAEQLRQDGVAVNTPVDPERILLAYGPDGWALPCGCAWHYFDGKPHEYLPHASEENVLIGVVQPHIHPCKKHRELFRELFAYMSEK